MDTSAKHKCILFKGNDPWGLPGTTRWGCIITVVRLTIACVLLWYGTLYVVHTINLSDLVLNCFVAPRDLGRDRRVIHFFKYSTPPREREQIYLILFISLYVYFSRILLFYLFRGFYRTVKPYGTHGPMVHVEALLWRLFSTCLSSGLYAESINC